MACAADSKFSNRHVTFESNSNRDIRFEFESNLEASQVPIYNKILEVYSIISIGPLYWQATLCDKMTFSMLLMQPNTLANTKIWLF